LGSYTVGSAWYSSKNSNTNSLLQSDIVNN
jgi:hypothetical protein